MVSIVEELYSDTQKFYIGTLKEDVLGVSNAFKELLGEDLVCIPKRWWE